jgi:hypothetical protein
MNTKLVTFSVDIGVQIPVEVDDTDISFDLPYDKITVCDGEGKPIPAAKVICHTTTDIVDSYTEEEAEGWQKNPLPEEMGDDGP